MPNQTLFRDPQQQPTEAMLAERLGSQGPLWHATVAAGEAVGIRWNWAWDETGAAWGYRGTGATAADESTICTLLPCGNRVVATLDLTGREVLNAEDKVESSDHQDMIAEMKPVKRMIGDKRLDAIYEVPFYRTDDLPVLEALLAARLARQP